jgi:hypothetical protein
MTAGSGSTSAVSGAAFVLQALTAAVGGTSAGTLPAMLQPGATSGAGSTTAGAVLRAIQDGQTSGSGLTVAVIIPNAHDLTLTATLADRRWLASLAPRHPMRHTGSLGPRGRTATLEGQP